jgi:hypothetical protein
MLGMEHMEQLTTSKYLFANKFLPSMDYGAISCWHEWMFNRTHLERGTDWLRPGVYLNRRQVCFLVEFLRQSNVQVRFNRERHEQGDKFDASKFNCTL